MALLFTVAYVTGGDAFLSLLTDEPEVIEAAGTYLVWALAIPVAGMAAFIWDGIYIGATNTRGMLQSMAAASAIFFLLYYGLHHAWGNHALWLAFLSYLSIRGIMQTLLSRRMTRQAFPLSPITPSGPSDN